MKFISFFSIILLIASNASANNIDSIYNNGVKAFEQKQYSEAAKQFELSINRGVNDAATYYNLGTSYLHLNQYGKARLNLEKARLLDPFNKATDQNLEILQDRIQTTIIPLESFFLKRWWQNIFNTTSSFIWALIFCLLISLALLCLYIYWFKGRKGLHKKISILLFLAGAIALIAGISRHDFINNSGIVIIQNTTDLKASASENSDIIKILSPGVKLRQKEAFKEWIKVTTTDLEEGWVLADKTLGI